MDRNLTKLRYSHMIRAVIFDMDGLLIDSEPFWQKAEIEVFSTLGVSLTQERVQETMGLRVDEVIQYWYSRYPWKDYAEEKTARQIVDKVIELVQQKGIAKKGVYQIMQLFTQQKLPIAIASSSWNEIINAVVDRINIGESINLVHSAQDEPYGKPHPGVYITTAQKLGVAPSECLAFEDSPNGLLSAKAAKMKCVAVPDETLREDKRLYIADMKINSLEDFSVEVLKQLQA